MLDGGDSVRTLGLCIEGGLKTSVNNASAQFIIHLIPIYAAEERTSNWTSVKPTRGYSSF